MVELHSHLAHPFPQHSFIVTVFLENVYQEFHFVFQMVGSANFDGLMYESFEYPAEDIGIVSRFRTNLDVGNGFLSMDFEFVTSFSSVPVSDVEKG